MAVSPRLPLVLLASSSLMFASCMAVAQKMSSSLPALDFCYGAVAMPEAGRAYLCETAEDEMALIATSDNGAWEMLRLPRHTVSSPPFGPTNTNSLFRIGRTVYVFGPAETGETLATGLSIDQDSSGKVRIARQSPAQVSHTQFFDYFSGTAIERSNDKPRTGLGYSVSPDLFANRRIVAANSDANTLLVLTQDERPPYSLHFETLSTPDASSVTASKSRELPLAVDPLSIWNAVVSKRGDICLQVDRNLAHDALPPSTPLSGFAVLCANADSGARFEQVSASDQMILPVYDREHDLIAIVRGDEVLIYDPAKPQLGWERKRHTAEINSPAAFGFSFAPANKEFQWLSNTVNGTDILRLKI